MATIAQIVPAATGWQPHTARGAIAGALKRLGLTVGSVKVEGAAAFTRSGARLDLPCCFRASGGGSFRAVRRFRVEIFSDPLRFGANNLRFGGIESRLRGGRQEIDVLN